MAGERAEALPDDLRDWVERKATELDATPEAVLSRAVTAYRLVDDEDDPDPEELDGQLTDVHESIDALAGRIDALEEDVGEFGQVDERIDTLDDRVGDLKGDVDEKIQDVRERVVQIKRETDAKASEDHAHPELRDELTTQAGAVEGVQAELEALQERIDAGFENYEDVLDYLTDAADELDEKVTRLAGAVVDLRHRANDLEAAAAEREAVAEIKGEANRLGIRRAVCEDCEGEVDIGLLAAARCPHCSTPFADVDPPSGFFGSATLVPGRRPALEGGSDVIDDPEELFDEGEEGEGGATDD